MSTTNVRGSRAATQSTPSPRRESKTPNKNRKSLPLAGAVGLAGLSIAVGALGVGAPAYADSTPTSTTRFVQQVDPTAVCLHQGYSFAGLRGLDNYSWFCFGAKLDSVTNEGVRWHAVSADLDVSAYCDWLYPGAVAQMVGDPNDLLGSAWFCKA